MEDSFQNFLLLFWESCGGLRPSKPLSWQNKKKFLLHKQWMWRSFALTLSAITLRMWKVIIVYLFHPNPMDVYQIIAWLGWIPNILLIEFLITKKIL
ncbi:MULTISPECIES: DUF2306 domain-containing protein [Chryseobacterium]|uniref:DUF2306 domain-containing protein n=1 Tax=Chryseobacterium TaxID=59732 RepID=UPI003075C0A9